VYYSLIVTANENGLNPYEYLTWVLTNMPNLGKPGFIASIEDLLPWSDALPKKVFIPRSKRTEPEKYAWEED
jgi:transposase